MVSSGPSTASGGMTTFTREPSGSRASHSGSASSTRRPSGARMRSIAWRSSASEANAASGRLDAARALDPDRARPVDHDLVDARVAQQRLERAQPERALGDERDEVLAGGLVEQRGVAVDQRADARGQVGVRDAAGLGQQLGAQVVREALEDLGLGGVVHRAQSPSVTVSADPARRRSPAARGSSRSSRAKARAAAR